jgi:ATP-dependent Lon protease
LKKKSIAVTTRLGDYLGVPKFRYGEIEAETSLASSPDFGLDSMWGELLTISAMMPKGQNDVTGNLRDVMKVDLRGGVLRARVRCLRHRAACSTSATSTCVPEGTTPKDGPSAGVAMVTAIVSVTGVSGAPRRRHDGEITCVVACCQSAG